MAHAETIVEAGIADVAAILASASITTVDLVAKYILRISNYDCRNTALNAIPLLNEHIFEQAAAADDRRAAGEAHGALEGVPFTVKDSYKVKGMTVASGSEAFQHLVANEDAFIVKQLRSAGAILIGKTNMCPMAYGGMLRGLYGRAESPYNSDYLAAAFGSGSSNGSGVSTAASFAVFGMGGETVSSGRSPASNNALVVYTPSRGLISPRGTWPLYPTCDVIIPHTRTVDDLLVLLNVLVSKDEDTAGDFWRDQPFLSLTMPSSFPPRSFTTIKDIDHLKGKRIAVPNVYISQCANGPYVSDSIRPLWDQTQAHLEAAGATVEIVSDFSTIQDYLNLHTSSSHQNASSLALPENWNAVERGALIAHAWEDFLQDTGSSTSPSLMGVDPRKMFPHLSPSDPQVKFTEPRNAVKWSELSSYIANRKPSTEHPSKSPIYSVPYLESALRTLESARKAFFEDWLSTHGYDYVVFPAVGDVARSDADVNTDSAQHAWTEGVQYSHGVRALRHMGIPSVTVPMGILEPQAMPIGLTILARAYHDVDLLKAAYAFEQVSHSRVPPPLTPPLASDAIPPARGEFVGPRPTLQVTKCLVTAASPGQVRVCVEGSITPSRDLNQPEQTLDPRLEIFVDGTAVDQTSIHMSTVPRAEGEPDAAKFSCEWLTAAPPEQDERNSVVGKIARDSTMVMILARLGETGRPSGYLKLIHVSDMQT